MTARTAAQYLAVALRSTTLICAVFLSLAWWLATHAGIAGIPLRFILLSGLFSWSFALLDRVASGNTEPPVLSIEMLNAVEEKRALTLLLVVGAVTGVLIWCAWHGQGWAARHAPLLAALACSAILPAILALQSVSGHVLQSFDPREWLKVMAWLRGDYALAMLCVALLCTAGWLLYGPLASVPRIVGDLLLLLGWFATFALIGGAAHERRDEAELIYPPDVDVPETTVARQRRRDRQIDRIYGSWRNGAHGEAWKTVQSQVAAAGDPLEELRWIYERVRTWPDQRLADRLVQDRVTRLLGANRPGEALDLTRARLALQPRFRPRSSEDQLRLAELARAAGDRALERLLREGLGIIGGQPERKPMNDAKIIYTLTDEAPALATYSLLPIVQAFSRAASIVVETRDISLAGRIIANFPDKLTAAQKQKDDLAELGELAKTPEANIIKLPNISASVPQLKGAIKELQSQGYDIPDYPEAPTSDAEKQTKQRYAKVLGSAVNPVLREGNSDRRVAKAVKQYAKKHPHSMGKWAGDSATRVAHMSGGDFYGNEQASLLAKPGTLRIEFTDVAGKTSVLKDGVQVLANELVATTFMSRKALCDFYEREISAAKAAGLLISLHLKATMMKVSDPILFGHAVSVYFKDVFAKHAAALKQIGANPNNGFGDVLAKITALPAEQQAQINADIQATYAARAPLAMVDSDKGITNLHVPSDVIIDASMPAAIRASGRMWGADGKLHDMIAMIPDRCYAGVYQAVIDDCRKLGAYDVPTMGNVANVGLMAQAAEEYGSHDKTFELAADGVVRVLDGDTLISEHTVAQGDIWRLFQTKDVAIRDWVKLAVNRARATGAATIFWLDEQRAYDRQLIARTQLFLKEHDTAGLDIRILSPVAATTASLERLRAGQDTISVTGNVLRDYLTDLFPILELGTSAKMLSIVPLLQGGGMYETGAGGSAPKHVQQFLEEGHLRWDSLGEFLALQVSIEDQGRKTGDAVTQALAEALDSANGKFLDTDKSPSRKVGELDVRGSHFYLALYWAQALASDASESALRRRFAQAAQALTSNEAKIVAELNGAQGKPVDVGGYFHPDAARCATAMRPSATLNRIIDSL